MEKGKKEIKDVFVHSDSGLKSSGLMSLNKDDKVEFTIEQRDGRGIVRLQTRVVPTVSSCSNR